jgi:type II restriction/modification system DNA methylase subunit YeeA
MTSMPGADVISLFWEWQRRHTDLKTSALAELALDKCEERLIKREWEGFQYWHAVYLRERRRLSYEH